MLSAEQACLISRSSVDLGIVWEVGSRDRRASGTCENFEKCKSMI